MCLTNGIRFINHSPSQKTEAPNHDETNTPTRNTKSNDVTNPSPAHKKIQELQVKDCTKCKSQRDEMGTKAPEIKTNDIMLMLKVISSTISV